MAYRKRKKITWRASMTAAMDEASEHVSAQRLQGSTQNNSTPILPPAQKLGKALMPIGGAS
jgi:hypothetical protein